MISENNICILEHPRSGGNYLHMLISKNFFGKDWASLDSSHNITENLKDNVKYVYLYRDTYNTIRSVYLIKEMFYIRECSFHKFLNTKYCDMYDERVSKYEVPLVTNRGELTIAEDTMVRGSRPFKGVDMKPVEYHTYHVSSHTSIDMDNLLVVSYENLINNFDIEMQKISNYLSIEPVKNGFIDIKEKVGFYLQNDTEIHGRQ